MTTAFKDRPRRPEALERVPVAEEAERVSVVAAMEDPDALALVLNVPIDAFTGRQRTIRTAIGRIAAHGGGVDLVSVGEDLYAHDEIGPDGTFQTLADFSALANDMPMGYTAHVETYLDAILSAYVERVQWRATMRINTALSRRDRKAVRREIELALAELDRAEGIAGGAVDDGIWRPETQELADLMTKQLPATRWFVDGLIPEGVLLFAGKAKYGKTTLACHLCASIAAGAPAMGQLATERCEVLYIAAEDNERRMQRRMGRMLQGERAPLGFHIDYTWPKLDQGGLQALDTYCAEHPAVGVIVIDTLEKVRAARRNGGGYQDDYASVADLQGLAAKHQVAVVVLHHLRKASADDPFDEINASMGMLAAVDNMMVMRRGQDGVMELHRRGREYDDDEPLALQGDKDTLCWRVVGKLDDVTRSSERNEIIEAIRARPGITPKEIAGALGKNESTVKNLLAKLLGERRPIIRSQGGHYYPVD